MTNISEKDINKNSLLGFSFGKIPLTSKLYMWSLIFEPLLFFIYASSGQTTGIPLSLSRILQIIVVVNFLYRLILKKPLFVRQNLFSTTINKYFIVYIGIVLISSLVGIFVFDSYEVRIKGNLFSGQLSQNDVPFLKNNYVRPFFDIFLFVYYYFYFIVLAKKYINTKQIFIYFMEKCKWVFYFVLVFGFIDLLIVYMTGSALIKRHIGEATDVGLRFHSFAGEPRDAFVYLLFGCCILFIYHHVISPLKSNKKIFVFITAAIVLTQSASGILGVLIGGLLALSYFITKRNRKAFSFLVVFLALVGLIIYLIPYSPRLVLYIDEFSSLYSNLKDEIELPYILLVQSVNFLPIWGLYNKLLNYNIFQFLFGSGFSTSAYFNMNYIGDYSYSNANSQLTRILFEGGLIGTVVYLLFLVKPVIHFFTRFPAKIKNNGLFLFFLLIGASLAHRSLTPFIFLGITVAYDSIYKSIRPV
jgi:hypothetical protein